MDHRPGIPEELLFEFEVVLVCMGLQLLLLDMEPLPVLRLASAASNPVAHPHKIRVSQKKTKLAGKVISKQNKIEFLHYTLKRIHVRYHFLVLEEAKVLTH